MLSQFKHLRRVVITGFGCVTPIGIGRAAFWTGLQNGLSGVRRIDSFDVSDSPVKIAAQVQGFDWEAQLGPKDRKHVPRTVPLALAAARVAFWLGYLLDPMFRAPGMAATFMVNIGTLLAACWLWLR